MSLSSEHGGLEESAQDKVKKEFEEKEILKVNIISLLMQLKSPKVRGDIINGAFQAGVDPNMLQVLDQVRWCIVPRWQSVGFTSNKSRAKLAVEYMENLINRSDVLVPMASSFEVTYAEIMSTLDLLATDQYWEKVSPGERCAHLDYDEMAYPLKYLESSDI